MKFTLIMTAALTAGTLALASCGNNPDSSTAQQTAGHKTVLPGEQAPPMDPGQNNFGGSAADRGDTTGRAERLRQRAAEMNRIRTVHFNDL